MTVGPGRPNHLQDRRGLSGPGKVTLLQVVALLPPLGVAATHRGTDILPVLCLALLVTLFWDVVFSAVRKAQPAWHSLTTALILAVIIPETVQLWQAGLALSFGVVIGEQVFGGRGFGFLNPAVAALAFLVFSFHDIQLSGGDPWLAIATLPGACLLLVYGYISWRVFAAMAASVTAGCLLAGGGADPAPIAAALTFGVVFLVCDPVAAASTNAGRWLYGLLVGFLVVLFTDPAASAITTNALVFAALLGSLFAPLLDHIVVLVFAWRRRKLIVSD